MTPVQNLLKKLIDFGCEQAEAIELIMAVVSAGKVDAAAEKRRAWDRNYRRRMKVIPPEIHPNSIPPENTQIPPEIHPKPSIYVKEKLLSVKKLCKKVRKKELIDLPENWLPPERSRPIADGLGLDVEDMEARWRDYLKSSGKLYADHDAAFCNYLRNEPKFRHSGKQSTSAKPLTFAQANYLRNQELIHAALGPKPSPVHQTEPVRRTLGAPTLRLVPVIDSDAVEF